MTAPPAEPAADGPPPPGVDPSRGEPAEREPAGSESAEEAAPDGRLYVRGVRNWRAVVKTDFAKQYCHLKTPGEDYYHLLTGGELYLDDGEAKLCLNCAVRSGVLTADRFHWRREPKRTEVRYVPLEEVDG